MERYGSMTREELVATAGDLRKRLDACEARLADISEGGPAGPNEFIHTLVNWDVALSDDGLVLKWVVDREAHSCLAINDPALDYFEYSRPDFMALRMPDFFPPGTNRADGLRPGLLQYRHANGETGVLQVCHLDINYLGRPARLILANDVSRHWRMEDDLKRLEENFRLFAENIREMIWVASPDLRKLFYVNHACSDILGITRDDLYQGLLRWEDIVHPDDHASVQAAFEKQKRGEAAEVEVRIVRRDGKVRWIRVRSFPVKNGSGELMASGIAEDVTDRKQLEEERHALALQQRTNLVREVHHRIKNNLQGVAGLLRQYAYDHPEVSPVIDLAVAQVRTVAIVHGLQGKAADNEVVLCEMVPTIAHTVETLLPQKPAIEVRVDVPQRVRVSEQESVPIALILNELIMNAAKHAPAQQRIAISVNWNEAKAEAHISIVNSGSLPAAFEFDAGKGTGTGLELVRSLLPPVGGKLSFASDNGEVRVTLELSVPSIYNL